MSTIGGRIGATLARHGARRRHPHAGRAEPHGDFRRDRELPRRRRIPGPARATPATRVPRICQLADRVQEIRRRPELHAGRAVGGPHQPQGDDRGVGALQRQCDHACSQASARLRPFRRSDAPRRDDGGNSFRRRAGHGRHDPGADQAADQRPSRPDAAAGARHAVQEPRLRQSPDRADGHRDALYRARGGAEGSVAARRRLRRCVRSVDRAARPAQPHLRRRRPTSIRRQTITASTASFSIDGAEETCNDSFRIRSPTGAGFARRRQRRCSPAASAVLCRLLHGAKRRRPARFRPIIASAIRSRSRKRERTVELFIGTQPRRPRRQRSAPTCSPSRKPGGARRPAASSSTCRPARRTQHAAADAVREVALDPRPAPACRRTRVAVAALSAEPDPPSSPPSASIIRG